MKRVKKTIKSLSERDKKKIKGGAYLIMGGKISVVCPPPEPENIIVQQVYGGIN